MLVFLTYQKYWSEKLGTTRPGGRSDSLVGGKTRTLSGLFCGEVSWPYRWRGFCGGYWRLFGGMFGSLITKEIQRNFQSTHPEVLICNESFIQIMSNYSFG